MYTPYIKNLLVRNPVVFFLISLFCFLYKDAISRNSLKYFLIQQIRIFSIFNISSF